MKNLTDNHIRAILAFLFILGILYGFVVGLIASEVFMTIASMAVGYYFQSGETAKANKKVEEKEAELQVLKNSQPIIVDLDGKKKNI